MQLNHFMMLFSTLTLSVQSMAHGLHQDVGQSSILHTMGHSWPLFAGIALAFLWKAYRRSA